MQNKLYSLKDLTKESIVFYDSSDEVSLNNMQTVENAEKFDILFHKSLADSLNIKLDSNTHICILGSEDAKDVLHLS